MIIAIDFDGTIVDHRYPDIGNSNPYAFWYMHLFQSLGAKLILYTMRSGKELQAAVDYCRSNGIEFWAVNTNPEQSSWTQSPKVYAHLYIDDAAYGCPLRENPRMGGRPMVNWSIVGPEVVKMIESKV